VVVAAVPGAVADVDDDGPVPLSEVALPPIGIRFISLGIAPGIAGIVVLVPGCAVDGAGCAQTGTEIASAATAATPIKICFTGVILPIILGNFTQKSRRERTTFSVE
jgi:hypothetical protein